MTMPSSACRRMACNHWADLNACDSRESVATDRISVMGAFAARFRFAGEPPSGEQIDRELSAQLGRPASAFDYRRGKEIAILVGFDAIAPHYAIKVLRDLGGTRLHYVTGQPWDETLPAFVEKPWLEHDEDTRRAVL